MKNKPRFILIHCSDVSYKIQPNQFLTINTYHRDVREFPISSLGLYGGYHILVSGGRKYRYRNDDEVGAHCNQTTPDGVSLNFQSLGICIAFDGDIEFPTPEDSTLIKAQIEEWVALYHIPLENIYNHRHFTPWKTCPGSLLTDTWGQQLMLPVIKQTHQVKNQAELKRIAGELTRLQRLLNQIKVLFHIT